jgi:L-arabinose isomerase
MADGYGFAAEGDWKTAALVRAMKVMAAACRAAPRSWRITPIISIRAKAGARRAHAGNLPEHRRRQAFLAGASAGHRRQGRSGAAGFQHPAGPALNAVLMDFGNRFRLLVNEVDVVKPEQPMPKLPVAQAVWKCRPDFEACAAWIYAGGAHHTGFSQAVTTEMLEDFAAMAGSNLFIDDKRPPCAEFKKELRCTMNTPSV